jgi:Icc-related predicted phosphoesterase
MRIGETDETGRSLYPDCDDFATSHFFVEYGKLSGVQRQTLVVVAVADTHLFHDELVVPDGDVFIHAGDLCRGGTIAELARAAEWIQSLPHRYKIVIAGNHDWPFQLESQRARAVLGPSIIYLQDSEVRIEGFRFWGSPWQPAFHSWAFNLERGAQIAEKWAMIPEGLDVLVTHGPPAGIGDRSSSEERTGCADLRRRVREQKPRVHLFGHIHEDGGAWHIDDTLFANVTTWECERAPTVIELKYLDHAEVRSLAARR